jgi:hypothetical protein
MRRDLRDGLQPGYPAEAATLPGLEAKPECVTSRSIGLALRVIALCPACKGSRGNAMAASAQSNVVLTRRLAYYHFRCRFVVADPL